MKTKGFTFVELIAAMAMMSVIMLAMNYVFSSGVYSYVDGQRKEKAVNANKVVMTLLSAELKNSNKYVVDPAYKICDALGNVIYDPASTAPQVYKPKVYIEGNAYGKYMYVLKKVGTKKVNNVSKDVHELDKFTFVDQKRRTYIPADIGAGVVTSIQLTDAEMYNYFNTASNYFTTFKSENIVGNNLIDGTGTNIDTEYDTTNAKMAYEPLGQNCYLIAHKSIAPLATDPFYKIKMVEKEETTLIVKKVTPIKISDNIGKINLTDEGYECKIHIEAIETNHEEEINTSTTILNYRGVS